MFLIELNISYVKINKMCKMNINKNILVMCILYGVAIASSEDPNFSITESQMMELADTVCTYLELSSIAVEKCKNLFLNPNGDTRLKSPKILEVNRSQEIVSIHIAPSKYRQLVVLVPKENADDYLLDNQIVEADEDNVCIETEAKNVTIFARTFDAKGRSSPWSKGPDLTIAEKIYEHRNYEIQMTIPYNKARIPDLELPAVDGLFKWNSSDDADSKFFVTNTCQKKIAGDVLQKIILPSDNRSVIIDDLLLDDTCVLEVEGLFGSTSFEYHTPSCDDIPQCNPGPDIPHISLIEAKESYDGTWDVHIQLTKPKHIPQKYNVTIHSEDKISVTIPGDKTEVTISNVCGQGFYDVSVIAISWKGNQTYTSKRAFFPAVHLRSNLMAIIVAGAWCGVIICAVLSSFACWRRQRIEKKHLFLPPPDGELKCVKFLASDASEIEPIIEDAWEILPERLLLHEVIGEGAFGVVRRGMLAGKEVAVKMLKDFPSRDEIRSFRAEMELMKSVGEHPHVVSLVGCCTKGKPLIVAEYCGRGDLLSYLRCFWDAMVSRRHAKYYNNNIEILDTTTGTSLLQNEQDSKFFVNKLYDLEVCDVELTPLDLLSFCRQIAKGMEFLAANRVVHRDLAARNILVSGNKTLKIADFGLSRDVYQDNLYKQESPGKMPVKWMAIESLTKRIYTTKSDVWSFGVVVWEVVTVGGSPYADIAATTLPKLLRAGYRLPRPTNCSPLLYDLMLSCWMARPRERPSFTQLHARLDELLQGACAGRYISLDAMDDSLSMSISTPPSAKRYLHMLFSNAKFTWTRREIKEKPHHGSNYNHYTSTPVTLTPPQFV